MGEVYLAQDQRLEREVAVKILPSELEQDPIACRRFRREARSSAGLDHPFIAQIHEVGEAAGRSFLVMEYLRGKTLRERLTEGPLTLEEALKFGSEMAEALHAAHSEGIIHRDLKPSNIMLTRSGHVKVMDFGLAKVVNHQSGHEHDQNVTGLTGSGVRLGTVAYMSPEQLKGAELDTRSDIFSFGILLYEMVTGRHPFRKIEPFETASAIIKEPPPPLPPSEFSGVTDLLSHVLRKTLAKHPDDRYQSAQDLRIDLDELRSRLAESHWQRWLPSGRRWLAWLPLLLFIVAGAAAGGWWAARRPATTAERPIRLETLLPAGLRMAHNYRHGVALSPDGRTLVVTGGSLENPYVFPEQVRLFRRDLDQWRYYPIPGTENGFQPVFSPDGRWLAFTRFDREGSRYLLLKVRVEGGEPVTLCECDARWGVAWAPDGLIYLGSTNSGLLRIHDSGGQPEPVTPNPPEPPARILPFVTPGGEAVLYTVPQDPSALAGEAEIWAYTPATGEDRRLRPGWDGRYSETGHLVFGDRGSLKATALDLDSLTLHGPEVTLVEGVIHSLFTANTGLRTGAMQVAFSRSGLLAYAAGTVFPEIKGPLAWIDRRGNEELLQVEPRNFFTVRVSPDGSEVLLTAIYPPQDIWLFDPVRQALRRQTFEGSNAYAIWGPGKDQLTFSANLQGVRQILTKLIDAQPEVLVPPLGPDQGFYRPGDWSPDGRTLAVVHYSEATRFDILMLDREGAATPFLATDFSEQYPAFSPDGRWLAYSSNESGRMEVYVRPYPGPGRTLQVSTEGGFEPAWTRDGREIIFRNRREFLAAAVSLNGGRPAAERPRRLFEGDYGSSFAVRSYDVGPDGRLLVIKRPESESIQSAIDQFFPTRLHLIQHWHAELAQRAPGR